MKKWFVIGAFLCGILGAQTMFAGNMNMNGSGSGQCCDEPTGECYCKYVRYEPCYYNTYRCEDEWIPCEKKCCRYVDEEYEVQKCRYVPEYYTVKCCRKVPEYYCTTEHKCRKKQICEPQCKYVPKTYWKHSCGCNTGCGH